MLATSPPSDLDADARRVWRIALAELVAVGSWTDATAELLGLYVRALMTARLARGRIAARAGTLGDEAAYFARGSMGQQVKHPDLDIARSAESDAASFGDRLMLSPVARHRASITTKATDADAIDGDLDRALRLVGEGGRP